MGLADRDYYGRAPQQGPPPRTKPLAGAPVTKALLIANIAVFIIDMLLRQGVPSPRFSPIMPILISPITEFGAFTVNSAVRHGHIWEFITFQFLHANIGHILFNSIGLYFFGPFIERWWRDPWRFLTFYLACGAAGGVFFTLLMLAHIVPGSIGTPLVGASAGIYGLLIGTAVIAPDARVRLFFPPIELAMRTFAIGLMVIAVLMILTNWNANAGGEAGHLGGAILGFLLIKYPGVLRIFGGGGRGKVDIIPPKAFRRGQAPSSTRVVAKNDPEIDRILDKISRHGLQSLSDKERAKLRKAAGE